MKKFFIFFIVAVLLVTFAGCGGNSSDEREDNEMVIGLKDSKNSEKVIKDKKFKTPKFKENNGVFTISAVIADHMVLQANTTSRVFGNYFGDGQFVGLEVKNDKTGKKEYFYGEADKKGDFDIWIGSHDYGGPYTLTFFDYEGYSRQYNDVLFGEVWILAGQSNMGWSLGQCYTTTINENLYEDLIAATHNDNVRWMGPWPVDSETPVEYLSSARSWSTAQPENVKDWSAIGFFFALRLNELYDVPVGVISTAMGGISIHLWRKGACWYNGMVNPVKKFASRGVVWYQGEGDYDNYSGRLAELIEEWRADFENPDLFWCASEIARDQREKDYYLCREEVKKLYGVVDKYTYAVTIDTGMYPEWCAEGDVYNVNGEHPYDKLKVGERLADSAAKDCYGAPGLWSCPQVKRIYLDNDAVMVEIDNIGEGLVQTGSFGFEMRSDKGNYTSDVKAELVGNNTVRLTWDSPETPVSVRYGYKNLRGEQIKKASESVCIYNTKNGEAAYPLEQFTENVGFSK